MLARAKINLSLHITGKRPDGYHTLESLVMFANVGDEVMLTPSDDFSLQLKGPYADALAGEAPSDNLVSRAALALAKSANINPTSSLMLLKQLPIGAGLGGGSSDAAAALHLLNEHWKLGYTHERLAAIGQSLGSDIPACIYAKPLWMQGAGEKITPCAMAFDIPILLVNPGIHSATKDVYTRILPPYEAPGDLPAQFSDYGALLSYLRTTTNHLQDAAITIAPAIDALLIQVKALGGCELARMSGSGSTCFALFTRQEDCDMAASVLYSRHPDYWIRSTILQGSHHG